MIHQTCMPAKPAQPIPSPPPPPPHDGPGDGDGADAHELVLVRSIQRDGPANTAAWTTLLQRYQDRLYAVCLRMVGNPDAAADLTQDTMVKIIQGLPGYDARSKLSTWMIRVAMNTCFSYLRGQKLRRHASLDAILDSGAGTDMTARNRAGIDRQVIPPTPARHVVQEKGIRRGSSGTPSAKSPGGVESTGRDGSRGHIPIIIRTAPLVDSGIESTDADSPPDISETNTFPRLFTGPGGSGSGGGGGGEGGGGWREQYREQNPEQSVEQEERRRMVAFALASLAPDQCAILVLRDVQGFDYDQIAEALGLAVGTVKSRLFRARVALREAIERGEGARD